MPAIFGVAAALALVFVLNSTPTRVAPSHRVVATVTSIYVSGAHFPHTVVIAHSPHAIDARASLQENDPDYCRVGDQIDGTVTGITLDVDPKTCRRRGSVSGSHK